MQEIELSSEPLVIGAEGMAEIRQNIRIILMTTAFSVPLDRAFANSGRFIDAPDPIISARLASELISALEKNEPRIKVHSITWKKNTNPDDLMNGKLCPVVKFSLKKGVKI